MAFIRSFSIDCDKQYPFPFNIAAIRFAKQLALHSQVTIFAGDNGSGKSTLLESLALKLKLPLIGGHINSRAGFEAAYSLQPYVNIEWQRQTSKGFFFRAEDFSDFVNSVERQQERNSRDLQELKDQVDDSIIERMSESMNFTLHQMRNTYGDNMQAYSHGEAFLKIMDARIFDKGIYLLDEPEAALSPLKQLSLMALILELLKNGNTQFILATHSPILMGFPDARIYEIQEDGIQQVEYKETGHYRITKTFLDNPDFYLRHLK